MHNGRDCEHGRRAGNCDSCDLAEAEKSIALLEAELAAANTQITGLHGERDALVAQNSVFRGLINKARDEYIELHKDGETDCVTPYDRYDATPAQCLRQIQAEAGKAGYLACAKEFDSNQFSVVELITAATLHAERVKVGKV